MSDTETSGGASPLFMTGHRQIINCISKDSQNIFIYNFIITTFDCQGGSHGGGISARAFALSRPGVAQSLPETIVKYLQTITDREQARAK